MIEAFDKRLTIPKRTKINNLIDKLYNEEKLKFKERLARARKITFAWTYGPKMDSQRHFWQLVHAIFALRRTKQSTYC